MILWRQPSKDFHKCKEYSEARHFSHTYHSTER